MKTKSKKYRYFTDTNSYFTFVRRANAETPETSEYLNYKNEWMLSYYGLKRILLDTNYKEIPEEEVALLLSL